MTRNARVSRGALAAAAAVLFGLAGATEAKTLRYTGASPILSLDPHSSSDPITTMLLANVYEPLVSRNRDLELQPGLATKWEVTSPTIWRFTLRQGVTFQEGQPFGPEDAKFSIERAGGGMFNQFTSNIASVTVVDDHTVDIATKTPDPLLPRWLTAVAMMSRGWSTEHDSAKAAVLSANQEQYAVRHANGTGPFRVASWDAGSGKVMLVRSDTWWGKPDGNVTDAVFTPIASAPTRVAALLSGDVDLVSDLPISDIERVKASPDVKTLQRPSFRQMMVLMSPAPDQPADTFDNDGKPLTKNPWRDLRVRQAVAHAIDVNLIVSRIMRGQAFPSGIPSARGLDGYQADLDVPYSYDPELSKKLLAEAGYPDGFKARFQCTNDRYPNDEAVCRALASMFTRVGIKADPDPRPWKSFVQDLTNSRINFLLLAQFPNGQTTFDLLQGTWETRKGSDGFFNWGKWSNADFDAAIDALKSEFDQGKRRELLRKALTIAHDQVAAAWLYSETVNWGLRNGIDAAIRQDAFVLLDGIKMN